MRPGYFAVRHAAAGAAIVMALFAIGPIAAMAVQPAAATTVNNVVDVSLSDLDLSTPQGMRLARDRLHAMAEHVCGNRGGGREPSSQPAFGACVDSTVASALQGVDALSQTPMTVLNSVTLAANVSLADLDLSTLEGANVARQRLEAMARRLCDELGRRRDLAYQPNYAACLHDSLSGAMAQADALAATRNTRTARAP